MKEIARSLKRVAQWSAGSRWVVVLLSFLITALSAGCAKPVPPPKYKFNPSPQERYRVTVRSNRPIPKKVSVRVQYEIKNTKCIPRDYARALGGVTLNYPIRFHPKISYVSEKEFEVNVAEDKILSEDYWGRGVCKWTVIAVIALYDGDPIYRSDGDKLFSPDRNSYLYGNDLRSDGWSVSGCVPSRRVASYRCTLFRYSSENHGGELSEKPPRADSDYQTFLMNSKRIRTNRVRAPF